MTLYLTLTSPYARAVRIAIRQLGMESEIVEVEAKTRTPQNETLSVNPTGKVPTLVVQGDDGKSIVLSESRLICEYLERVSGSYSLVAAPEDLKQREFEGIVTGFVDGVSVWIREMRRPEQDRSGDILAQERDRVARCIPYFESLVESPALPLPPTVNYATALLTCGLHCLSRVAAEPFENTAPALGRWQRAIESLAPVNVTRV